MRSALGAAEDAPALPFQFPLVVFDHGGAGAGADDKRVCQFPLHELMATHGFVTVVARHSSNAVTRVLDLPLVIDVMLARSADPDDGLFACIDPDRIGISALKDVQRQARVLQYFECRLKIEQASAGKG